MRRNFILLIILCIIVCLCSCEIAGNDTDSNGDHDHGENSESSTDTHGTDFGDIFDEGRETVSHYDGYYAPFDDSLVMPTDIIKIGRAHV